MIRFFRRFFWLSALWLGAAAVLALAWKAAAVSARHRRAVFPLPPAFQSGASWKATFDFLERAGDGRWEGEALPPAAEVLEGLARFPTARPRFEAGSPREVHVRLGGGRFGARRRALYARAPGAWVWTVDVPAEAYLEFFYGGLSESGGGLRFEVEASAPGETPRTLFSAEERMSAPRPAGLARLWRRKAVSSSETPWRRARVDLKDLAGRRAALRLRATALPAEDGAFSPAAGVPHVFWGTPVLWAPGASPPPPLAFPLRRGERAVQRSPDSLVLVVLESFGHPGPTIRELPGLEQFLLEGVDFQRMYTNAVLPDQALSALLLSRAPRPAGPPSVGPDRDAPPAAESLARALRRRGYRTAAVGALGFLPEGLDPVSDLGFDEAHYVPRDALEPARVCGRASQWLAAREGRAPFFLMVYVRGMPPGSSPPPASWIRTARRAFSGPWSFARWTHRARMVCADASLGRLFESLTRLGLEDKTLSAAVSLGGPSFRREPVERVSDGRTVLRRLSARGLGMREEELRALWILKHRVLPAGHAVTDPAQVLDVAPTLLSLLRLPPESGHEGRAFPLPGLWPAPLESIPRILTAGPYGQTLLLDGHYKYVRRAAAPEAAARRARVIPERVRPRFEREELYDLWTDAGERRDLVPVRRDLLARARRAMADVFPARRQTRLAFPGLGARTVRGVVRCPGGDLWNVEASTPVARRGSNEFGFELGGPASWVGFETWPPNASFTLYYLRVDGRPLSAAQTRVSKLGLPLFEQTVDEWFDWTKFPWMEGFTEPDPAASSPVMHVGRRPPPGEAP